MEARASCCSFWMLGQSSPICPSSFLPQQYRYHAAFPCPISYGIWWAPWQQGLSYSALYSHGLSLWRCTNTALWSKYMIEMTIELALEGGVSVVRNEYWLICICQEENLNRFLTFKKCILTNRLLQGVCKASSGWALKGELLQHYKSLCLNTRRTKNSVTWCSCSVSIWLIWFLVILSVNCYLAALECTSHQCQTGSRALYINAHTHTLTQEYL